MDKFVTSGKIAGLFGSKGETTLVLYDSFPRDFSMEEPVFVKIDSQTVPLFFKSLALRGQRGATAVFEDIDTEARAAALVGLEFSIRLQEGVAVDPTGAIEADDALFFDDLVGWEAELGAGVVGTIVAFIASDLNPLLEIELGGGRVLIPAHEDFVVALDETRRRVSMQLPEGLLDLNE